MVRRALQQFPAESLLVPRALLPSRTVGRRRCCTARRRRHPSARPPTPTPQAPATVSPTTAAAWEWDSPSVSRSEDRYTARWETWPTRRGWPPWTASGCGQRRSTPTTRSQDGAWVAEITGLLDLQDWPPGNRVILRKERPHPGAQLTSLDIDGQDTVHRSTAAVTFRPESCSTAGCPPAALIGAAVGELVGQDGAAVEELMPGRPSWESR